VAHSLFLLITSQDGLNFDGHVTEWLKNAESAGVVLVATIYEREHPTFDPSSFVIWLLATFTVIGGSKLSAAHDTRIASSRHTRRTSPEGEEEEQEDDLGLLMQNLSMAHAVGFVVFASIMLVVLFFFIRTIIILLVVIYCIASTSAMAQLGAPLLARYKTHTITHSQHECFVGIAIDSTQLIVRQGAAGDAAQDRDSASRPRVHCTRCVLRCVHGRGLCVVRLAVRI
jgi:hypothetical protein